MNTTLALLLVASQALAAEPKAERDLAYAEPRNPRQTIDIYTPAEGTDHPIVFWIHGGGWVQGDKAQVNNKPQAFADRGYVLVSINYRLLPEATIQQMAQDVAKAIHWTCDRAKDYGGDASRIYIMGHSAGAQLAALVSTDDRYLQAEGLSLKIVKGCVPVDGDTYDVPLQIATEPEKPSKSHAEKFGSPEMQKELSPVTHVASGKHIPPFFILYVADNPLTGAQAHRLAEVLQAAGIRAVEFGAEGKTHGTINADLGLADDKATVALWAFMMSG
ncbi:MAG TPA: alpha/beta hydrolase [Pirellulales bacterium]|jgi:acetyl esterase/lipase|nr:alpha/beta hydrolase [Pirellulales bacterium]